MSNFDRHLRFAKALRTPDEKAVKRLTDHFNSQLDLFTQCPKCHETLKGSFDTLKAHVCSQ